MKTYRVRAGCYFLLEELQFCGSGTDCMSEGESCATFPPIFGDGVCQSPVNIA